MSIRSAISADYDALCGLFDELDELHRVRMPWIFREHDGPARARELIEQQIAGPDCTVLVAAEGDGLVGAAVVLLRKTPELPIFVAQRFGVIDGVVVAKAARRRGIGRELVQHSEAWAMSHGAQWVQLDVHAFNEDAMRFYASIGYAPLTHRMHRRLTTR